MKYRSSERKALRHRHDGEVALGDALAGEPLVVAKQLAAQQPLLPRGRRDRAIEGGRAQEDGAGRAGAEAFSLARVNRGEAALELDAGFLRRVPDRLAVGHLERNLGHAPFTVATDSRATADLRLSR